ncbi:MAG: hypothetical protein O7G88_13740, partial [bacterium]|nr:hypothetical protein [bacterium]
MLLLKKVDAIALGQRPEHAYAITRKEYLVVFRSPSQIAYLPPDFNALHSGPSGNLTPTPVPHRSALVETLGLADNIHTD